MSPHFAGAGRRRGGARYVHHAHRTGLLLCGAGLAFERAGASMTATRSLARLTICRPDRHEWWGVTNRSGNLGATEDRALRHHRRTGWHRQDHCRRLCGPSTAGGVCRCRSLFRSRPAQTIPFWCRARSPRHLDSWFSRRSNPRPDRLPRDKRMLLILDSCEHVNRDGGGAGGADFRGRAAGAYSGDQPGIAACRGEHVYRCRRWPARPMTPVSRRHGRSISRRCNCSSSARSPKGDALY